MKIITSNACSQYYLSKKQANKHCYVNNLSCDTYMQKSIAFNKNPNFAKCYNSLKINFLGKINFCTNIQPSLKSYLACKTQACEAHLKPKSEELYLSLTKKQQQIINKYSIPHDNVFAICGILRKKLSKFDTARVIETRYRYIKQNFTNGILKISDIPENIIDEIKKTAETQMNKAKKEKELIIITGRCGSGKTRIPKFLGYKEQGYYIPDADDIKPLLPNYKNYGAGYVQEASVQLNAQNLYNALRKGIKTVTMTIGYKPYLEEIISKAKENGYKNIKLIHVDTTIENSIQRVLKRELKTGRSVDPAIIEISQYVDNVPNYNLAKMGFSSVEIFDNNNDKPSKIYSKTF